MSTMKNTLSSYPVYFGPSSTDYPQAGTVYAGEYVQVYWSEKAGEWCCIEYFVGNTRQVKRGFVLTKYIDVIGSVTAHEFTGTPDYLKEDAVVYYAPYAVVGPLLQSGSVSAGERVLREFASAEATGCNYIEYDITGSSMKKRGYVYVSAF